MQVTPVIFQSDNFTPQTSVRTIKFEHGGYHSKNNYNFKDKAIIAAGAAVGVFGAMAAMAVKAKYSLKPSKMFKNIKNSYFAKVDFKARHIVSVGAGSCAGGLAAGYIVDKNPKNRRAKNREALMQLGNISIPILTVDLVVDKLLKKSNNVVKALGALGGIFAGVFVANFVMNRLCDLIFNGCTGRGVKATDYSAHLDDLLAAANYISENKIVHTIGRAIPFALMVAGNEVGNKTAE